MLCGEGSLVNLGVGEGRAVTLRCRSWGCPDCQPRRQAELIALACSGEPTTFLTLTVNPAFGSSPEDRARRLADAWRGIVKAAKRKYGYKKLAYLCVYEATKKGEPHLHILARVPWLDQRWLSSQMAERMDAPIVDIRRVRSRKMVASYLAKYVGKEPHRFGTCKRYWCTKDYDVSDWEPDIEPGRWSNIWELREYTLPEQQEAWEVLGWRCHVCNGMLHGTSHDPPF